MDFYAYLQKQTAAEAGRVKDELLRSRFDFAHQAVHEGLGGFQFVARDISARNGSAARPFDGLHVLYPYRNGIAPCKSDEVCETPDHRSFLLIQCDACSVCKLQQLVVTGTRHTHVFAVLHDGMCPIGLLPDAMPLDVHALSKHSSARPRSIA